MGVIKKFNPETGEWEVYGSTEAKDINLIDAGDNFTDKSVEGALREISAKLDKTLASLDAQKGTLVKHSSDIEWLKENGGGGSGNGGASAPTITSTFEDCSIDKENELSIPIFFTSPNLGEGTAYVIINNIEVASIPGIKQGNNTIEIGKLTELTNTISIYVKDRTNMLSNQLTWTVNLGGIDLFIDFDDTADYYVGELITMQYNLSSTTKDPLKMYMTIDYDDYEIDCHVGYNEFIFPQLGVGVHNVTFYITDGTYSTQVQKFNVVIVNSSSLHISSTFEGGEFSVGYPVQVQYRISKASNEFFDVNLYINGEISKTLICSPGTYYWTLNDLDVGHYKIKIEVRGAYDDPRALEYEFDVILSGYEPLRVIEDGLIYRLNAKGRTNQDSDKANPIDDSGNGVKATLHNFNWYSNGWINGELVCDGEAYAEIDFYPYESNALYGSTIEINYTAIDVGKNDARILDYTDIEKPYKGIYVDIEDAAINSLANTGMVYTDRDVDITLSFVIDRKNKFAKVYIDGICSRAFSLSDSGSGTSATREDFTHVQKIFLNSKKGLSNFGACKIKDFRIYNRALTDDEIVRNCIAQISDIREQERQYNFNFHNTTLPVIRMYGDMKNMTLETPVPMRIKYTSPNEDKYGQSFDLPYCQVNWQGTSSLQYVLKNFTARLKDENMAVFNYTPYPNGILEDTYCFKADYMESTHSRNVGIAKFVNDCLYDSKNPAQLQNPKIRNSVNGFPAIMYINDELQGMYNFNLDRYSTKSFGYTDEEKVLVYEISANSDTTAGAFFSWTEASGKDEESYYKSDFECLYPPTRAAGNDSLVELKRLIEWVDTSSDEDFKDNIGRYFNLEYLLRYYLFVLVFGAVDSLGKNAKLASFDGGLTWYFQVYDADTTCGLNNSGFLLFGTDIEMGDENVFNTTGSRLWARVVELFQAELKAEYALMRQGRFTVDNIMSYLYGEQISKIPATYYNQDMQRKYLDFGSSYLYALHGSGEKHLKKWIRERLMYVDTLLGYMVSSSDYITIRSNKLGYVYMDIQMYIPMYVTVKWRDEAGGTGIQTKRVAKGETVRFEYNMPTETDQEILVYAGHYIKSLGDLSNLQPSTLLIANANRLTEMTCHSPNLINTDLSECKMLQKIDISDCTALGTGIGAQPILNIQNAKYLRYLDTRNTQLTAIYTMQSGSNLEEIYYPKTIQTVDLMNQAYLRIVGIPYDEENGKVICCPSLADITINNCQNVEHICYPYDEGDYVNFKAIKQVQNLTLINSLNKLKNMSFNGFNKLKTITLNTMHSIEALGFDDMLKLSEEASLESVRCSDCPLIDKVSFNISDAAHKVEFVKNAKIDLGGMQSVKTIESNASIKGLKTLIIPTSTKELKFIPGFGDGTNSVVNVWSASANHANDNYEGMDLLDISLTYLDMAKLDNVTKAINFHIAPTEQHPNMNTERTGNYFKPEGSIDLTHYSGDMKAMLKGVNLSLLDVTINDTKSQTDLSNLFEGAIIHADQKDKVNNILNKFNNSNNWSNMFKNADIKIKAKELVIPKANSYREMNLSGMFAGSNIADDIIISDNIRNVSDMYKDCKSLTVYEENWENSYSDLITTDCYAGTGGDLEYVPVVWGGYGFFDDVTSEIVVNILKDEYEVVIANRNKVTTEYGIVNWGDGTISSISSGNYSHTFEKAGVYTIKGHFTFGSDLICNTSLNAVLVEVKQIATNTTNLSQAFRYCAQLQRASIKGLNVVNFNEIFEGCKALTEVILEDLDTSSLTTMSRMFMDCSSLEALDLSNIDTSNVRNMDNMFNGCGKLFDINVDHFNTENVLSMTGMFSGCKSLQTLDLSSFNTRLVSSMANMFYNCNGLLNLDISNFNTAIVDNMTNMFSGCTKLVELNLSNFNTANVKQMVSMFSNCSNLTALDISKFTTNSALDLSSMFYNCNKLTSLNLSKFTAEKVESMSQMFYECKSLIELDVSNFKTTEVTNMYSMFYNCKALTSLNLTNWNTSKVTNMGSMFYNCSSLLDLDLSNFITSSATNMGSMFYGCESLRTLNIANFNTGLVENMYSMFHSCSSLKQLDLSFFTTDKVTTMAYMFYNCAGLTNIDVSNFNTINVTTMYNMFYGCKALIDLDLSGFITNSVSNIGGMFNKCESLVELDLSSFNTANISSMASLFYNCTSLADLDLSSFTVDNVTDMSYMFNACASLSMIDLSHFRTPSLKNMTAMFYGCSGVTEIKLDNFDTNEVTNMSNLFFGCSKLTSIDLSSFDTSKLETMNGMFNGCRSLESLNINHFVLDNVTNMSSAFTGCSCEIILTNKNTSKVKSAFAMFNVYYGTKIDLSGTTLISSTNNGSFLTVAHNLVEFHAPSDISSDIIISADKLSVESLMSIINNLVDSPKTKVLEIGSANIAKLTDEQLAIAINKNWTVC